MQQYVAFLDLGKLALPALRNRAFFGQQGSGAELERNLPQFFAVDPVLPVAQMPDAASHDDRHAVRDSFGTHRVAQSLDSWIGIFRLPGIFGVGQAIMTTRQPRIFIDHRCHEVRNLVIGPLPQRPEGACGTDDRQIIDTICLGNFGQLIRHAGTAGNTSDHAFCLLEYAFQYLLRATHFPQDIDIDRALAARNFIGLGDLSHRTVDRILDQFLMPLLAFSAMIDLRDDIAMFVIAIRVDSRYRANTAGSSPGSRTGVIGGCDAFSSLDQWPYFLTIILDGF